MRRWLVALSWALLAALPTLKAADVPSALAVRSVLSVGMTVSDMERSIRFYTTVQIGRAHV